MAPRTKTMNEKQTTVYATVTSLQETAETIQGDTLQHARARFYRFNEEAPLGELMQQPQFFEYFKFELANCLGETIAAHDEQVQEVYYFDPNLNPDAQTESDLPLDPTVNLLVLVKSKTAALQSFIKALDSALTQQVRSLPSPLLADLNATLNAILISEEDVVNGCGYAVLLKSLYNRPRRLWPSS